MNEKTYKNVEWKNTEQINAEKKCRTCGSGFYICLSPTNRDVTSWDRLILFRDVNRISSIMHISCYDALMNLY
jgi:hypothetical protein